MFYGNAVPLVEQNKRRACQVVVHPESGTHPDKFWQDLNEFEKIDRSLQNEHRLPDIAKKYKKLKIKNNSIIIIKIRKAPRRNIYRKPFNFTDRILLSAIEILAQPLLGESIKSINIKMLL